MEESLYNTSQHCRTLQSDVDHLLVQIKDKFKELLEARDKLAHTKIGNDRYAQFRQAALDSVSTAIENAQESVSDSSERVATACDIIDKLIVRDYKEIFVPTTPNSNPKDSPTLGNEDISHVVGVDRSPTDDTKSPHAD